MTVEWVEDAAVEIELTGSIVKFRGKIFVIVQLDALLYLCL